MSAVTVYCAVHRKNHGLTAGQAEVAIQTLASCLSDEQTHPTGVVDGRPGWEVINEWCVLDHLQWVRDPECYYEHIESMRESRLVSARPSRTEGTES